MDLRTGLYNLTAAIFIPIEKYRPRIEGKGQKSVKNVCIMCVCLFFIHYLRTFYFEVVFARATPHRKTVTLVK